MILINIGSFQLDLTSTAIGMVVAFFLIIIWRWIKKKKKPTKFVGLRELIDLRYKQLIEGAKGYHEITEILDEVEKGAKR